MLSFQHEEPHRISIASFAGTQHPVATRRAHRQYHSGHTVIKLAYVPRTHLALQAVIKQA